MRSYQVANHARLLNSCVHIHHSFAYLVVVVEAGPLEMSVVDHTRCQVAGAVVHFCWEADNGKRRVHRGNQMVARSH
jgi:hypothetical protein